MAVKSTLKRNGSGLGPIEKAVAQLNRTRLLVGIPSGSRRDPEPGEKGTPPSNGVIGYMMEFGDAAMNLPARPFLRPGVRAALPEIRKGMLRAATGALSGKPSEIKDGFDQAGLMAVDSVQRTMLSGGFAPLSQRTIEARARRKYADTGKLVGAKPNRDARTFLELQKQGTPDDVLHEADLATPLLDTRDLFRSIKYIVRQK
ncbi:hypothetical protein D3273_27035 [Lichenibacterium minor]|uniref:Uncharacterized protein n=1 Tax=Lichenibacterium minor TaxID=2316528 RepID=A0A4Q2U2F5_9HYPH|nr:hypothetical protein [Lichenibacterium minor]RYC28865.1 hypothetical protein D3273_27035 [Lichenibacterium minor]